MEGVEPPRLSAVDFESTTSAIPSHTHKFVDRGGTGSPTTCFKAGQAISCVRMRTWFNPTVLWNHPEPRTPCTPHIVCLIPLHGQKTW